MDDQNQERRQKSGVDRANDAFRSIKNIAKWGNRARGLISIGSTAASTAMQAVGIGGGTAVGAGCAAVGIILLVIFFVAFIILFPGMEGVGSAGPPPPTGPAGSPPVCNPPPVGPPSGDGSDCPIPGGSALTTCGSLCVWRAGCGHCSPDYLAAFPMNAGICASAASGTAWAMDVGSSNGTTLYLPRIDGQTVSYIWVGEFNTGNGFIQYYDGSAAPSGDLYRLQLHHTAGGSGNPGIHFSGSVGGIIGALSHVHIQLAKRTLAGLEWVDAPLWLCN